jgi:hypothetical protein
MKTIDIFNLSKYLRRTGDNKLARIGHVNSVIDTVNGKIDAPANPSPGDAVVWNGTEWVVDSVNPLIPHLEFDNTLKTIWNKANSTNSTSFGLNALSSITNALNCTAYGNGALQNITVGNTNVAFGTNALQSATSATLNLAVGAFSLTGLTTGAENVGVGYRSLRNLDTGSFNVALGSDVFVNQTTASNNIGIGRRIESDDYNGSIGIGHNITFTGDNQLHIGSSLVNAGTVTTESLTSTKTWTVYINGVQEKILLA